MIKFILPSFIVEEHIKNSLKEDIGFGDITTEYLYQENKNIEAYLRSRVDGILCGIEIFKSVFKILSKEIEIETYYQDGDSIVKDDVIAKISGSGKEIILAERVALNYIQRLSGIASETKKYVDILKPYKAKIVDTRKSTPGFRIFEKYAVKTGGGSLHRFNLSDCVMIKDNHIKLAGSITTAVDTIRENISHAHKIEVECDTKEQVIEALNLNVDIIMLDNMDVEKIKECVKIISNRAIIEVSGNVNKENIEKIAQCGVDIISTSALVTKAGTLDLGLDMK